MIEKIFKKYKKYNNDITEENFNNYIKYQEEYNELKIEFNNKIAELQSCYKEEDVYLNWKLYNWQDRIQVKIIMYFILSFVTLAPCIIETLWIRNTNINIRALIILVSVGLFFFYKTIRNFIKLI